MFEPRWLQAPILLRALQMATIAALAFQPVKARAEATLWGFVGHWSVYTDAVGTLGCYAERTYRDATFLTVGLSRQAGDHYVYLTLANAKWTFLKEDKANTLRLKFGSSPTIKLSAKTIVAGGVPQVLAIIDRLDFLDEFQKHDTLRINLDGSDVATLKLDRATDAFTEVRDCQTMMTEGTKRSLEARSDPFAKTPSAETQDDPFAKSSSQTSPDDPFAKPPASSASDDPFAKKP